MKNHISKSKKDSDILYHFQWLRIVCYTDELVSQGIVAHTDSYQSCTDFGYRSHLRNVTIDDAYI